MLTINEVVILTKFHKDRATIVYFSVIANFWGCTIFVTQFLLWYHFSKLSGSFTHEDFKEPIDIALDLDDNVVVADNGIGSVLVFETSGKLLKTIGKSNI